MRPGDIGSDMQAETQALAARAGRAPEEGLE